jgi:acyl carrier protein
VQAWPKVGGVYAIEQAIAGLPVDFVMLLSSNAAVLGGLGFLSYAAANLAMDTFALARTARGDRTRWLTTNWDHWPQETRKYVGVSTSMDEYAMTREEANRATEIALTRCDGGQVVIATGDLRRRLALWVGRSAATTTDAAPRQAAASGRPRPNLRTVYVAPRSEIETKIAALWAEFLGVTPVGVDDDFFELGGHSLLAAQLMAEIGRQLDTELPLRALFEQPTIAHLAEVCATPAEAAATSSVGGGDGVRG